MCLRSETSVRTRPDMANSRIPRTSISKRVLVQTLSSENEFDLYANEPHSHECFLTKTRFDTEAKGYSEIDKSNTRTQDVKSFLKNTYTLKRMAIKIHCSSLFTCRPLGLGSFPTVFFARILVLSPRTPSPVFVLFIFRFVIWLVMTPRCVS